MMNIKQLCFSCLAIAFCACQSEQESFSLPEEKPIQTSQKAYWVSPSEAKHALEEIISFGSFKTRSSASGQRTIEEVIDLSSFPATRSASAFTKGVGEDFYVVTFADNQGYALVSKDKRTFPVFAILDEGSFSIEDLENNEMLRAQVSLQQAGKEKEIQAFEDSLARHKATRSWADYVDVIGDTSAFDQLYGQGWKFIRSAPPRLETCWGQETNQPLLYLKKEGASYAEVYGAANSPARIFDTRSLDKEDVIGRFGCTTVAYAQVMYALRNCEGFKDLTYSNGEKVLWDRMTKGYSYLNPEAQRLMGWFTENCSPYYWSSGTMIFNTTAKDFLRKIVGEHIHSRYENCIITEGDPDGYGWSESTRVVDEFFKYDKCFVIMTGSPSNFNFNYHTFVIDGIAEFQKRMQGSGFLGLGIFKKWRDGVLHLYHVNPGWKGRVNGYFLYVQNVNDEFDHIRNREMDYDSNTSYFIVRPK